MFYLKTIVISLNKLFGNIKKEVSIW
jgi:hypothetical protein